MIIKLKRILSFTEEQKVQQSGIFVSILFFLGLFVPTTIYQWMQNEVLYFIPFFIFLGSVLFLGNYLDKWQVIGGVTINLLLWLFTAVSSLRFSFGEAVYYLVLFVAVTSLFQIKFEFPEKYQSYLVNFSMNILNVATSITLLIGLGIVCKFRPITNLVIGSYPYFYDGLVESMVFQGKPVISFGTHSLAGFYLFLFFLMNILAFIKKRSSLNLIYSLLFMLLLLTVKSTTSLLFLLLAIVIFLVMCFFWKKSIFGLALSICIFLGIVVIVQFDLLELLRDNLLGKDSLNGLSVRYRQGGVIYNQIVEILKNPFIGTGTRSIDGTFYIDCGITHVAARIGIVGMIIFYGLFYRFIKNNIRHRYWGIVLFSLFVLFEVGFANLLYFRTVMTLPFVIFFISIFVKEKNELFLQEAI